MPARRPSLLAAPPPRPGRLWLTDARLLDGTGAPPREASAVLVQDGTISAVGSSGDAPPEDAQVVALGGRTLMPGLTDAHTHVLGQSQPEPAHGAEPLRGEAVAHFIAADLRAALRMGITTIRDVGSFDDHVLAARQAMRYGATRGPRLLTCGRILSATAPGGRFFEGMYREADGEDDMRRAAREQLRRGADFVKIMATGARSVELEDPDPAQMTRGEIATVVEEAHRQGYRVAAHAEGLAGTELAIEAGVDTIEHGMYLNARPDLLERMAAHDQVLVPTLSCFYGVAEEDDWSELLGELARHNIEQAGLTLRAAKAAGVRIAAGHDWAPIEDLGIELLRMIEQGLTAHETLVAATSGAAFALGLDDTMGTIEPGRLADLVVVDGDPLARPELLRERHAIWLVLQLGEPVAGAALETGPGT